ncbi:MAG: hypothetical protein IJX62_06060 [Clostridia bacterium]|nr:hypothetical protein [Clostridia bacterium]
MNVKDFSIVSEMQNVKLDLNVLDKSENCVILKFEMQAENKIVPSPVRINWEVPVENTISVWAPLIGLSRSIGPNWNKRKAESKTAAGAPVLALVNNTGISSCTVAISDAKTPTEIGAGISEEKAVFLCNATFFTSYISPIDHYEAYIRIDFEKLPFTKSVEKVSEWW